MDDLPELPFEKVLSYLSLEDLLKLRAVSRRWYTKINSFRVKSLCYSERPTGRILEKSRLVGGAFAPSFFRSSSFERFFNTFGQSILSSLKKLRLCELRLNIRSRKTLAETLHSFGQLEELSIIRFSFLYHLKTRFGLNLPMLHSIHLEGLRGIEKLTLDAPRLQKVKLRDSDLRLEIVHTDSVERLDIDKPYLNPVKKLKNLKFLYAGYLEIDSTFPSDLKQLKEIHLVFHHSVKTVFKNKQRNVDLKIYLYGYLLNDPKDLKSGYYSSITFLAANPSRMADEIPFWDSLEYSSIECIAPELAINVLNRFTDLSRIVVDQSVQDIQRFLNFLKSFGNIVVLEFWGNQLQGLFDRLPEHCAVQKLSINCLVRDLRFLFRLENLVILYVYSQFNVESVRKVLELLPFLSEFKFWYNNQQVAIVIENGERFRVSVVGKETPVGDVNAAIQFIISTTSIPNENKRQKK